MKASKEGESAMEAALITKMYQREVEAALERATSEIRETQDDFQRRNMVSSSIYIVAVYKILFSTLRSLTLKRVEIEKDIWRRAARRPRLEDGDECKRDVRAAITETLPKLLEPLEREVRIAGYGGSIDEKKNELVTETEKLLAEADREIDIWIGLATVEAERPAIPSVPVILNFQNYGIFQAGDYSQAFMAPQQENKQLIQDMKRAKEEIAELKELRAEQKEELTGALNLAIAEMSKEKPNRLTVGGIITSVGSATGILANASKAYETIKSIGGYFGVTLP